MTSIEKQNEQAIMEQLLSREGYHGFRIIESDYNRQYESGAFEPQYLGNDERWHGYSKSTANRYSVKSGMRSRTSTLICYKSAKGAMGYLMKQGCELEK